MEQEREEDIQSLLHLHPSETESFPEEYGHLCILKYLVLKHYSNIKEML